MRHAASASGADKPAKSRIAVSGKSAFAENVAAPRSSSAPLVARMQTPPNAVPAPAQVPWLSQAQAAVAAAAPVVIEQSGGTEMQTTRLLSSAPTGTTTNRSAIIASGKSLPAEKRTAHPSSSVVEVNAAKRTSIITTGKSVSAEKTGLHSSRAPLEISMTRQTTGVNNNRSTFIVAGSRRSSYVKPDNEVSTTPAVNAVPAASAQVPWSSQTQPAAAMPIAIEQSDRVETHTTKASSFLLVVNTAKRTFIPNTRSTSTKNFMTQPLSLTPDTGDVRKMPVVSAVDSQRKVPWE